MLSDTSYIRSAMISSGYIILCILLLELSEVGGLLSRPKRQLLTRTCDKKYCVLGKHSACLQRSEQVQESGVSEEDKRIIVNEHNRYRSDVQPSATNMMKMSWDEEVAEVAQVWAETCQFNHDKSIERAIPGRFSVGQNLAMGQKNWENVLRDWYKEISKFVYGSSSTAGVGHFTQMVWASSVKIGCGFAKCDEGPIYVCNYGPAGNVFGQQPFERGEPCVACPGHCTDNLCDCKGKVCMNGGTMDLKTCMCTCKKEWHVGSQCGLNCDIVNEPGYCGKGTHDWTGCQRYYNVPYDCPVSCRACPSEIWDEYDDCEAGSYAMKWSANALSVGILSFGALFYYYYF